MQVNDLVQQRDAKMINKGKKHIIPNIEEEAEMLEWAGISFGEEDTFKLGKSIKRFAQMSGADRLRFVGKMYGTHKDYWLTAGTLRTAEETDIPTGSEKRG